MNNNQNLSEQLSFARISDLLDNPSLVPGRFDDQHLKDLHAYIFQDSSEHKPGVTRANTKELWYKDRELEALKDSDGNLVAQPKHPVAYLNKGVGKELNKSLKGNTIKELSSLNQEQFSEKISDLYSKLDYIHPFYEGNSRTLRTFTHLIAKECGYKLDWNTSNASPESRNELYNARDVAVYEHFYEGKLNDEFTRKAPFKDNGEYLIAMKSNAFKKQQEQQNKPKLKDLISQSVQQINQSIQHTDKDLEESYSKSRIHSGAISSNLDSSSETSSTPKETPTISTKKKDGLGY